MANILFGQWSVSRLFSHSLAESITGWVNKGVTARRKRSAMLYLLQLDEARLTDLGLCRQDVLEALNRRTSLNERRAERAGHPGR